MSKIRQHPHASSGDIDFPAEPDLGAYVVFTQLNEKAPHVYAGWLDAPDEALAMTLAREHYGQDQVCTNIWIASRAFVAGMRVNREGAAEEVSRRSYQVFTQQESGDQHRSGPVFEATCAADALEIARTEIDGADRMHNLWAIPCARSVRTAPGEVIWRHTDQSCRLAGGYGRIVREKWERIREATALEEYEKDDLAEAF